MRSLAFIFPVLLLMACGSTPSEGIPDSSSAGMSEATERAPTRTRELSALAVEQVKESGSSGSRLCALHKDWVRGVSVGMLADASEGPILGALAVTAAEEAYAAPGGFSEELLSALQYLSAHGADDSLLAGARLAEGIAWSRLSERTRARQRFEELLVRDGARDLSSRGTVARVADEWLQRTRRIQIGDRVPDIVGASLDGTTIQLSSFRGQVVLLSFFGFW